MELSASKPKPRIKVIIRRIKTSAVLLGTEDHSIVVYEIVTRNTRSLKTHQAKVTTAIDAIIKKYKKDKKTTGSLMLTSRNNEVTYASERGFMFTVAWFKIVKDD